VLQRGGWPATVVQLDGQRADVLDALAGGRINLAIDNLSGLLEQVTGFAGLSSPDETRTLTILSNRLADLGLVALQPASATPGVDFLVTKQVQTALGLTTLSDLARVGGAHPAGASLPPLPTTSPAPTAGDLGIGSTGTAVLDLQSRLTALGYPRVPSSSRFDEATRRAVVGFQLDHGIIATGAAGPATLRALSAAPPTDRPSAPPSPGDTDSVHPGPITKTVYLAFAGGPSAITDQLLGLLRAHSATASFFATDAEVGAHPDALHAAATAGNATGVSMDPHDGTTAIGDDAVFRTAARTQDDLAALLGRTPSCLLAPYGAEDSATRARATDRGWKTVVWDVDPQDWRRPSAAVIVADVVAAAHPGAIVLLHDGGGDRTSTVQALGPLLDDLSARGYSVSAIPDCA
jgi:peptidoglycan/xylan/chitin deacetylase (PgdA/CDA1 family)